MKKFINLFLIFAFFKLLKIIKDFNLLGEKKLRDETKKDIQEVMFNIFKRYKSLSRDNLKKELKKNDISQNDIEMKLDTLLKNNCTRYKEGGEIMYFLKH